MIRRLTYCILFLASLQICKAQQAVYTCTNGQANFYSSAPLEDIEASNSRVSAFLNTNTRSIEIRIQIKQFEFKNKLMQEHFNENFMESKRYPEANFIAQIYEKIDFNKPGVYNITATGEFSLHGVEKIRTLHGKLTVLKTGIIIETQFDVLLADHKIEIPEIVFNKVAEKIRVNAEIRFNSIPSK